jgi:hypothetical protein
MARVIVTGSQPETLPRWLTQIAAAATSPTSSGRPQLSGVT